ncbi:hypothetical protein [Ureibacillus sp. FSL E2-3493]|uniref:hypothetical protein n=1 Tax=Ureibacillus sp. FSL E2-3493 TaxID=2921367 RepID=UPI003119340E
MTVNHGGNLPKEYFLAYINLVMNAHNCSLNQAEDYMLDHFLKGISILLEPTLILTL